MYIKLLSVWVRWDIPKIIWYCLKLSILSVMNRVISSLIADIPIRPMYILRSISISRPIRGFIVFISIWFYRYFSLYRISVILWWEVSFHRVAFFCCLYDSKSSYRTLHRLVSRCAYIQPLDCHLYWAWLTLLIFYQKSNIRI